MKEDNKRWDLISIASIPLVMTLGNSMLIPVLPVIQEKLDISSFKVSMIITVYSIVAIFFIPVAGYLSDRFGRKKIILPSLIIAAIGGLISALASWQLPNPYWLILAGRLIQGIGASGAFPVVLPLVGDMFRNEEEISNSLGIIETSNTLGKVLSPVLGAFLAGFIWYLPFASIPVFSLISILLVTFLVKSPKRQENPQPMKEFIVSTKQIFKKNGRWLFSIFFIGGIIMYILFGILFYLSTILEDIYHIKGITKGLVLAIPLLSLSLASFITGKKIGQNKVVMKWIIFSGSIILFMTLVTIIFFKGLIILFILLIISGTGIGVTLPSMDALITEEIEKKERGTITSFYSSFRFIGVALGPPIFSLLMKQSHGTLFSITAVISLMPVILSLLFIKPSSE